MAAPPDLFSSKVTYTILFPEALEFVQARPFASPASGSGRSSRLDLDAVSGQVRVEIRVDRKYLPRRSEEATITKGLLSGDAAINFLPHLTEEGGIRASRRGVPPGRRDRGRPTHHSRSLLTPASGVLANAQQSLDRMVKAFEKLEKLERLGPKMEDTHSMSSPAWHAMPVSSFPS